MRAIIAATLLSFATLSAQQASYTYLDQYQVCGRPIFRPVPTMIAQNLPQIGTTFRVSIPLSNRFRAPGLCLPDTGWETFTLCTGVTNPNVHVCRFFIFPDLGTILTSAEISFFSPWGAKGVWTTVDFPIPNHPALVGASFFQQVYYTWGWQCHGGYVNYRDVSRGGHGVIGT